MSQGSRGAGFAITFDKSWQCPVCKTRGDNGILSVMEPEYGGRYCLRCLGAWVASITHKMVPVEDVSE